jgi:hypothetical protein
MARPLQVYLDDKDLERLEAWARGKRLSLFAAAERAVSVTQLDDRGRTSFEQAVDISAQLCQDCPTVATLHDLSVVLYPQWHPADRVKRFEKQLPGVLARCAHFLSPRSLRSPR